MEITDKVLRAIKKDAKLDAGYNNITLRAKEFDISDGDIEELLKQMALELLDLRREYRKNLFKKS
jgi:hypothetical protein